MTASVQSAPTDTARHSAIVYHPGTIASDAQLAAHLARGRALQGQALRESFAAVLRPLTGLLGSYGRDRERYARVPAGPPAAA